MTKIKPHIILVRPQLPENIGMVARAMDNCGLKKLILVSPREKWPNKKALSSSANSDYILKKIKIYKNLDEALFKYNYVIATSSRKRFLNKPTHKNFDNLFQNIPNVKNIAIVFGPENSGLSNDDLMLCDSIFTIDLSNSNTSLNLSHAVLLMSFKWRENFNLINSNIIKNNHNKNATKKDFKFFIDYLRKELNEVGFLHPKHKSKSMFNNIQTMLLRSNLNKSEIQTLWGMIKKLRNTKN